jgi:putative lipoprotein
MTVQKKDTPMLRASLSIILLAGWTAATPVARSAADDQIEKLTIKGSVTYEAGAALPPGSRAVIELRHLPALPNAPSVADQRIDLEGKQSPVPFEFSVERFKLVGGVTYVVRGAIVSEKRAIWTADDVKIDVTPSTVDVKEITLRPVKAAAPALDSVLQTRGSVGTPAITLVENAEAWLRGGTR